MSISALGLTGCAVIPDQLHEWPLISSSNTQQSLNFALQPNAKVFIGLESNAPLSEQQLESLQSILAQEASARFPQAFISFSDQPLAIDNWLHQAQQHPLNSDYVLVVRLQQAHSGNVVRKYKCDEAKEAVESAEIQSVDKIETGDETAVDDKPKFFHRLYPFGPTHDASSATLDDLIERWRQPQTAAEKVPAVDPAVTEVAVDQKQIDAKQLSSVPAESSDKSADEPLEAVPEPNAIALAGETPTSETIDAPPSVTRQKCGFYLSSGADGLALTSWLYTGNHATLLNQRTYTGNAGVFGWQLETLPTLFRKGVKELLAGY